MRRERLSRKRLRGAYFSVATSLGLNLALPFCPALEQVQWAYAQSSHTVAKQSALPPHLKGVLKWVAPTVQSEDDPWFVCLRLRGPHSLYISKVYGIQARYRSWTAEWRRHRPNGYQSDEGVGLITDQELARLWFDLESASSTGQYPSLETVKAPPCDLDIDESRTPLPKQDPQKNEDDTEIVAEIWLRRPPKEREKITWRKWTFFNPHLLTDHIPRNMIRLIEDQIRAVAPESIDLDLLLSPGQSGSLYLQVSQASEVWVDGVYRGQWPSVNPLKLSEGKYHLRVAPLDRRYAPVSFDDLEVLADKKTKFKVELELNETEESW